MPATLTSNDSRLGYLQPSFSSHIGTHPSFLDGNDNRTVATSSSAETVKQSNMSAKESIRRYLERMDDSTLGSLLLTNVLLLHIRSAVPSVNESRLEDESIQRIVNEVLQDEDQMNRVFRHWMTTHGQFLLRDYVVEAVRGALPQLMRITDEDILQAHDDLIADRNDRATLQDPQRQMGGAPIQLPPTQVAVEESNSATSSLTGERRRPGNAIPNNDGASLLGASVQTFSVRGDSSNGDQLAPPEVVAQVHNSFRQENRSEGDSDGLQDQGTVSTVSETTASSSQK